jgi:hypothetical protein
MRLFQLDKLRGNRVCAKGLAAEGIEFGDGQVVLRWYNTGSITIFKNMQTLREVHCSDGNTGIVYDGHGTALSYEQQSNLGHTVTYRGSTVVCVRCSLSKDYWEHFNVACTFWRGADARPRSNE